MPRRRFAHVDAELSGRITSLEVPRAQRFDVDVDRKKEIDARGDEPGWRQRTTPPVGSIGYTGSYREPSADVVEVSVVSVLEARGPD